MNEHLPRSRFVLMALTLLALLAGMWAGLLRLGWKLPGLQPMLPITHGSLMVSGFLGTLIGVERAVALRRRWTYLGPLLSGLGGLLLIVGVGGWVGPLLVTLGSVGLVAVFVVIVRRQTALFTITMGLGALTWLVGNALWLASWPVYRVVLWWAGFLIFTIAGERLELARVLRPSGVARASFVTVVGLLLVGIGATMLSFDLGMRLAGVGMVALALWLWRYDVARRTVRKPGITRYVAVCLLSGYVWLGVGGLMGVVFGGVPAGPHYDALLHAIFLGFVFSMIFGHVPIILPAVLGGEVPFRPTFYVPLALLHLSLVMRVAGDLSSWFMGRRWGGMLNVVVLLLFIGHTVYTIRGAKSETGLRR